MVVVYPKHLTDESQQTSEGYVTSTVGIPFFLLDSYF